MVNPNDVWRIVSDAARLLKDGELVVFGSGALAFWLADPPRSRDVDLWCTPPDRADALTALMGEMSWYHDRHGAYVEVWAPETFAAPGSWRARAKTFRFDEAPGVEVVVPHPHDVLVAKLERMDPADWDHVDRIAREVAISPERFDSLVAEAPHRQGLIHDPQRVRSFDAGAAAARQRLFRHPSTSSG